MSANISPIFVRLPFAQYAATGVSANSALDGTGSVVTFFTADATNGSKVERIRLYHQGTNPATVVRIFMNNGSSNSVANNNALIAEIAMPAYTLSQTAVSPSAELFLDLPVPAGYVLNCTTGTALTANISVSAFGGPY